MFSLLQIYKQSYKEAKESVEEQRIQSFSLHPSLRSRKLRFKPFELELFTISIDYKISFMDNTTSRTSYPWAAM